jgi:hypothetical protein
MYQGKTKEQTNFSEAVILVLFFAGIVGSIILMLQAWGFIPLTFK